MEGSPNYRGCKALRRKRDIFFVLLSKRTVAAWKLLVWFYGTVREFMGSAERTAATDGEAFQSPSSVESDRGEATRFSLTIQTAMPLAEWMLFFSHSESPKADTNFSLLGLDESSSNEPDMRQCCSLEHNTSWRLTLCIQIWQKPVFTPATKTNPTSFLESFLNVVV